MDPTDEHEDRVPGTKAGDQIGLGRVVENRGSIGSPDPDDPPAVGGGDEGTVDEASEASFPASDPPTFMSDSATPRDRDRAELPRPDEVP
jgi:hypothetical protein